MGIKISNMATLLLSVLPVLRTSVVHKSSSRIFKRMSSWSVEKNILVNLDIEERRKKYKVKSYVTLDEVPTLRDTTDFEPPLARDVEIFGDTKIRSELNESLFKKISLWKGDITKLEIDAIVNAANSELKGGGGVDGAIHRAAGPYLLAECTDIKGCPTGEARMSGGYCLPAKYVIHTVGPTNKSHDALTNCYISCFALQRVNNLKSIAFPCIATGIYHFPNVNAAHIACKQTRQFLEDDALNNGGLTERVIFCLFEEKDEQIYKSVVQLYFPRY